MPVVGTTTAASNDVSASTMTLVLAARSLVNVMDVGMVQFTITPVVDFGVNDLAFVSFPTYYNPNVGMGLRCSIYDAKTKKDTERVFCKVAWDWTLQVWGPAAVQAKAVAFNLRIYGVQFNTYSTAGKFGVGLTNSTYWGTDMKVIDYKTVADGTKGTWAAKGILDVTKVSLSSTDMRSTTDITVEFTVPVTSDTSMASSDFVAMELPFFWMGVTSWADGTATPSASLSLGTTTGTGAAAKTTYASVKGAVSWASGSNLVFALDTTATKIAENAKYRFVVSGVPTAWHATWGPMMNLGSLSISVGKLATGSTGWSSA